MREHVLVVQVVMELEVQSLNVFEGRYDLKRVVLVVMR